MAAIRRYSGLCRAAAGAAAMGRRSLVALAAVAAAAAMARGLRLVAARQP
jgi:hypothetical protein